jgi:hypothetical protein
MPQWRVIEIVTVRIAKISFAPVEMMIRKVQGKLPRKQSGISPKIVKSFSKLYSASTCRA